MDPRESLSVNIATYIHDQRPKGLDRSELLDWVKENRTEFVLSSQSIFKDCWLYKGSLNRSGYGIVLFDGKCQLLHRLSLAEKLGRDLESKEEVRHLCAIPGKLEDKISRACFNPNHLVAGSSQDNVQDMIEGGRQTRGEVCGRSKLTENQVRRIRFLYAEHGFTQMQLGEQFGVDHTAIGKIVRRIRWNHI